MYEICIEDTFDAAHCLRDYEGNCSRLHGHTYRVAACFRFASLQDSGMALDFRNAKALLRDNLKYMDHSYINELPEFSVRNPTAENLAKFIYDRLKAAQPNIYSVTVWETPTSRSTYFEE